MTRFPWLIVAPLLFLPACRAQQGTDEASIARWISDLGSAEAGARRRAEAELGKLGAQAEASLRRAKGSSDTEVREAAARLLARIEWNRHPPLVFLSPPVRPKAILRIDPAGGAPARLFELPGGGTLWGLRWSPEGRTLAFVQGGAGLRAIPGEGGEVRHLEGLPASEERSSSWSPDGSRFLFVSKHVPAAGGVFEPGTYEQVYGVRRDTKGIQALTRGESHHFDPCWSPDGNRIAYAAGTDRFDLFAIPAGGGDPERLTSDGLLKTGLVWSPDGRAIVFTHEKEEPVLAILELDTKRVRRLTARGEREGRPIFSPDGRHLAFLRGRVGAEDHDLWILEWEGRAERALVEGKGRKGPPTWSPDGKRIAFHWEREEGHPEIYSVGVNGSGLERLTRTEEGAIEPAWAPYH